MTHTILVTGGAGFIGSALVHHLLAESKCEVVNVDCLTYAGNLESLADIADSPRHTLERVDVRDGGEVRRLFEQHRPDRVIHLAAESHVDRSIDGPRPFLETNVMGTYTLLEAAREHWNALPSTEAEAFRFLHVSTDEVYGSLEASDAPCTETRRYAPSSPYAATKAAADHLALSWHRTFGLPVVVTNCCNNYGPRQFPEKFIPHMIVRALQGRSLPLYGDGEQVRDWLYVEDHARALVSALERGKPGRVYNIGASEERENREVLRMLCDLLDAREPAEGCDSHRERITHVEDRPGHDRRYALDPSRAREELGWRPRESFEAGLEKTVEWYLENRDWWTGILSGAYRTDRRGVLG